MDPQDLRDAARRRGCDGGDDPVAWLAAVERWAASGEDHGAASALVLALDDELAVREGTPPVVTGVRRDRLLRFDALSATWTGVRLEDAAPVVVRAARSGLRPAARRVLSRELTRIAAVVGATLVETAAVLPVRGWPAASVTGPALPRAVGEALVAVRRFRDALGAEPAVGPEELRVVEGRVTLASLSFGRVDAGVSAVARVLDDADQDELAVALRGAVETGGGAAELERVLRSHLWTTLVARRHDLAERWRAGRRRWSDGRLLHAVRRLRDALPPPPGRGALGVDLEGRIVVLAADPARVTVGAEGELETVWDPGEGVRPAVARRVLRLRAQTMPNAVLDARVGGAPGHVDAVCRWLAAGLELRTLSLLLERGVAG